MKTRTWQALLLLMMVLVIAGCGLWKGIRPPEGTLEYITWVYNVSEDKVREVASAYDADPVHLAEYGPGTFPVNYILVAMADVKKRQGYVAKEDVEAIVRGYELRCELEPWLIYYFFYATNIRLSQWRQREPVAMVIEFVYRDDNRAPSGLIVDHWWGPVNLVDDASFLTDRADIEKKCLQ